jgi:crotonobetaine/carnitine-CoA ligase
VAFVEPTDGADVSAEMLHDYCRTTMPKFMLPRDIHVLDELPRTPINKVEKYELRVLARES